MTPQPPVEPYILDDEYRQFMDRHYTQIARMMAAKRIRRAPWRVELPDGRVFKFTVTSYARKGTPAAAEPLYERGGE